MAPSSRTANTSWDPLLIISQIVSLQSLHYLTLSFLTPPLLSLFAEPHSLAYEGGAANVGMIMDWREMAGKPSSNSNMVRWSWSGGRVVGHGLQDGMQEDPNRGWVIAICWISACVVDTYLLYTLVRRPRLILDFACTLTLTHLLLTSYYTASLPSSLFYYAVIITGTIGVVVSAEQMCVKREMRDGLGVSSGSSFLEGGLLEGLLGRGTRNDSNGGEREGVDEVDELEMGVLQGDAEQEGVNVEG